MMVVSGDNWSYKTCKAPVNYNYCDSKSIQLQLQFYKAEADIMRCKLVICSCRGRCKSSSRTV